MYDEPSSTEAVKGRRICWLKVNTSFHNLDNNFYQDAWLDNKLSLIS